MDMRKPALAGGAALAAAAAAGAWAYREDPVLAGLAGLAVIGVAAAAVEAAWRSREIAGLRQELASLKAAHSDVENDISMAKDGMIAVRQAIQQGGGAQKQRMAAMEDEVAVLQKLVARLQEAGTDHAPIEKTEHRIAVGMSDAQVLELVRQAVGDGAVDLFLQPVVTLPQRRRRYYECFSRIADGRGGVLAADAYVTAAADAGLLAPIDNLLLFRAVQLVRRARNQNAHVGFFCNVSRHTLKDRGFLGDFMNFLEENPELAPSLILEIAQADWDPADQSARDDMDSLSALGVRFSLDRVEDLDVDGELLRRRGFRFVKVGAAELLADGAPDPLRFKRSLGQCGIQLIAEKIERERDLVELLEHDIDMGQGYLFGEPKAPVTPAAAA